MTRAEAKKQFDDGWLSTHVTAAVLGFDLDFSQLEFHETRGILATRNDGGTKRYRADDVLAVASKTSTELLNKHWPVTHQRNPQHVQTIDLLTTREKQDAFRRKLDRICRFVSDAIARGKLPVGELRLVFQLLQRCKKAKGFDLVLTANQIQRATRLDRETLPKARQGLERRNILRAERNGTTEWLYRLCDPKTGQPMQDEPNEGEMLAFPSESWTEGWG